MNPIAFQVLKEFSQRFDREPVLYFSPGRINLIGEHIDYNDGFVMPAAINKGIYYALSENDSDALHFYAVDFEEEYHGSLFQVKISENWKNYVLSVVNEFLLLNKNIKGFNAVFGGDIPRGSGLSSSAAVEGGLAFALNELFKCGLSRTELALLCQRAEHNFPGVQCGIMDQFANMMGKKDQVILLDCMKMTHTYFPLELGDYDIVLINSKVHHSLAAGEYNLRRKQCEQGLMLMGTDSAISSFRDIKKWENLLSYRDRMGEEVFMRCLYVVQEIERTQKAANCLLQNNLVELGKLMNQTHEGLSKLYQVSCTELDFLKERALQNKNVLGARMMGGGFGGCTINLVKKDTVPSLIENVSAAYEKKFGILPEAYIVETADGVNKIDSL
jgi:galactokinase